MESEIRILDRLEKRVSKLEQALLKQQADEYHTNEEKPAPVSFQVPKVEIRNRQVSIGDLCMEDDLEKDSYDDKYRENWQAIAHTCEMARRARTKVLDSAFVMTKSGLLTVDPGWSEWLDDLDAGPVKP